jgi:hypothetical protein
MALVPGPGLHWHLFLPPDTASPRGPPPCLLASFLPRSKTLTILSLITTNKPGAAAASLVPYKGSLATGECAQCAPVLTASSLCALHSALLIDVHGHLHMLGIELDGGR